MKFLKYSYYLKIYTLTLFILIAILLPLYQLFKINNDLEILKLSYDAAIKKIDNSKIVLDSIENDIFIYKTNQERYEVAIDLFKDENPIAYKQLEYILYNKTE
ncbi:MAG: hypothetical protein RLZZ172_743 [Bacteroidota bacterium]|jgi:hypothetical protein